MNRGNFSDDLAILYEFRYNDLVVSFTENLVKWFTVLQCCSGIESCFMCLYMYTGESNGSTSHANTQQERSDIFQSMLTNLTLSSSTKMQ